MFSFPHRFCQFCHVNGSKYVYIFHSFYFSSSSSSFFLQTHNDRLIKHLIEGFPHALQLNNSQQRFKMIFASELESIAQVLLYNLLAHLNLCRYRCMWCILYRNPCNLPFNRIHQWNQFKILQIVSFCNRAIKEV